MHAYLNFEAADNEADVTQGCMDRNARRRNAQARKKLERRRDRDLLRSHLEEVWNSAGLDLQPAALQGVAYTETPSHNARSGMV